MNSEVRGEPACKVVSAGEAVAKYKFKVIAMLGTVVSHYRILEKLGEGGMGVVYKAQDTKLLRPVALKFLSPDMTRDEDAKKRFIQEARAASSLDHPNIAVVHEINETSDGHSFICMAYYDGQTLKERMARGPMSAEEATRLILQIASGLQRAHESKIVHRDIKPGNIIITAQGDVKIVDFGLAKLAAQTRETMTQITGGTAAYMSPEQITGNEADARSDLFSLGVVFYEAVTGRRPFLGEHEAALFYSIANVDPVPPTAVRGDIPPDLEKIILRLLQKDPRNRYQSAADLREDLRRFLGESLTPRPVRRLRRALSGKRAVPLVVGTAIVLAAVILFATGILQHWFGPQRLRDRPTIGVLPFRNIRQDSARQYFCDGLFERVTSGLARVHTSLLNSRIIPATEMRPYAGRLREACIAQGLTLVVEGSVDWRPDQIIISVNLIDADSLSSIDSREIRSSPDVSAKLEEDIVRSIAEMMHVQLHVADLVAVSSGNTQDHKAYDFYIRGRVELREYSNPVNLSAAISDFRQAYAIDPRFTLAFAALGEAYWRRYDATRDVQWVDSSKAACERARQIDSTISEVCMSVGLVYKGTGEYGLAVREFQSVLSRDSLNADAYRELGETYRLTNDTTKAIEAYKKAIRLRPDDWSGYNALGRFYYFSNRNAEAVEMWTMVTKLRPNYGGAYSNLGALYYNREKNFSKAKEYFQLAIEKDTTNYNAYANLGTLYYYDAAYELAAKAYDNAIRIRSTNYLTWAGRAAAYRALGSKTLSQEYYQKAIQLAEGNIKINVKDGITRANLAGYYADVGRNDAAHSMIAEAIALGPKDASILGRAAMVSEQLGEREKALRYLKQAIQNGFVTTDLDYSPEMKGLREDPRYKLITKGG